MRCNVCKEPVKSLYSIRDKNGAWVHGHKRCISEDGYITQTSHLGKSLDELMKLMDNGRGK